MRGTVLITGGAGFIGSHLGRHLLDRSYGVRALDNLTPQVHEGQARPGYLPDGVDLVVGDIRDRDAVGRSLEGVDAVVHFAARVGVGQSMYEIADYSSVNTCGTGVLLEALMDHPVRKLLVASSMSIYGEGTYRAADGSVTEAVARERSQLERGDWEPRAPDGGQLRPLPTGEEKPPALSSMYALSKYDQERMGLMFGASYGVPTVALRFFNVYGADQALSNPYTGVLAIFAGRLLNDRPPMIFEDGEQRRDFVSVHDVVRACAQALEDDGADGTAINIGSGESASVRDIARRLAAVMGREPIEPVITGKYRVGDIRHCFADIGLARRTLGYQPEVSLEDGMRELAEWLADQAAVDRVDDATRELATRGLTL
jgi:dTDP-L-rhamnose 4-epimerase